MDRKTFTPDYAIYPMLALPYGKYKLRVSIQDIAGNLSQVERVFYVDEPSFQVSGVSNGEIGMGDLGIDTLAYSSTIRLEVETLGAGFKIYLKNNALTQGDG